MNRYLLRSLIAVLTFCIGVAVSFIPRFETKPQYRMSPCRKRITTELSELVPSPMMSIDSASTDPLDLKYVLTRRNPADFNRRTVELVVENNGERDVRAFSVNHRSTWLSNQHGGGGGVSVGDEREGTILPAGSSKKVSIECDADEVLTLWIGSCDFNDGSRWDNPRQPN
jgi:hypothetical protein